MVTSDSQIETPCRKICSLDPVRKLCIGCGRTRHEIAQWLFLSNEQRRTIMAQLPARLAAINASKGAIEQCPFPSKTSVGSVCTTTGGVKDAHYETIYQPRKPVTGQVSQEIGKIELLTPEEEIELARKIRQGGPERRSSLGKNWSKQICALWSQLLSSIKIKGYRWVI